MDVENLQIYTIWYKGLEHPWFWASLRGPGTNAPLCQEWTIIFFLWYSFYLFYFYLFFDRTNGIWKFLGQGSNLNHGSNNAGSLTAEPPENACIVILIKLLKEYFLDLYKCEMRLI